ncbi:MAG: hypothetical protein KDK28_02940 [Maritimibacter sp.]|nr:hypothetical protein [Maritimibacter sp.]
MDRTPPLRLHDLADALGVVRAEIQALKAREAELRAALIAARPNGPLTGRHYEVTLRPSRRRLFDRTRLPQEILDDARYWKTSVSQTLVARALSGANATGGEAAGTRGRAAAPVARREAAPGSGRAAARNPWPHPEPAPRLPLGAGGACARRRGGDDDDDDPVLFEDF